VTAHATSLADATGYDVMLSSHLTTLNESASHPVNKVKIKFKIQALVNSHYEKTQNLSLACTKALFQMNSEIHSINTRYNSDFHQPLANLTTYKNGTYYTGIKIFNYLPTHIKIYLIMLINLDWP
jgi:hypothetical protein